MQIKNLAFFSFLILALSMCQKPNNESKDIPASANVESQSEDEVLIRKTIDTYFEGWMTGDTTKLGKAMHATCQLKNVKDHEVLEFDRANYLSFFEPRERRKNAGGRVISVDITNDVAAAKCEIFTEKRLFTDYFNMMKIQDEWYIVDKIATNEARNDEEN